MVKKSYNKEILQLLEKCKSKDVEVLKSLKIVRQTIYHYRTGKINLRKKRYDVYLGLLRAYLENKIVDFKDLLSEVKICKFLLDEESKIDGV